MINDECERCADHYYGRGMLTEFNLSTGARYTIFRQQTKIVKPFVALKVFYSHTRYSGNFSGGFSGGGTTIDRVVNAVAGQAKIGLQIFPGPRIPVTLSSEVTIGQGHWNYNFQESKTTRIYGSVTLVELDVGYLF